VSELEDHSSGGLSPDGHVHVDRLSFRREPADTSEHCQVRAGVQRMADSEEQIVLGPDGQPLSKSALKKLAKLEKIAAKKAASSAAQAEAKADAEAKRLDEAKSVVLPEPEDAPRITVGTASSFSGKRVKIYGWVQFLRRQGALIFLELRDGSGIAQTLLQVVLAGNLAKTFDALTLFREASVLVYGTLVADERAKGGVELQADYWKLIGPSSEALENRFNRESNVDVLLDNRHLHIRSTRVSAVLKLRSIATQCFREFFFEQDCFEVTPPTLVQTQVEGGSDLFKFQYFGEDVSRGQVFPFLLGLGLLDAVFPALPRDCDACSWKSLLHHAIV